MYAEEQPVMEAIAGQPTRSPYRPMSYPVHSIPLPACYGMSGTCVAYGATAQPVMEAIAGQPTLSCYALVALHPIPPYPTPLHFISLRSTVRYWHSATLRNARHSRRLTCNGSQRRGDPVRVDGVRQEHAAPAVHVRGRLRP